MNLDKAWKSAKNMQQSLSQHQFTGIQIKDSNVIDDAYSQVKNRDLFYQETVAEARKMINGFLVHIGLDINHSIFQGGEEEIYKPRSERFLQHTTIKLVPDKYSALHFRSKDNLGKYSSVNRSMTGTVHEGFKLMENNVGFEISLAESSLYKALEVILHEYYHEIFDGEQNFRPFVFDKNTDTNSQNQLTNILMEGTVEILKQLTIAFYKKSFYGKGYPNEVALINHLICAVAEKLGRPGYPNYKLTLKCMCQWASTGGTKKMFVEMCKKIKTSHFPAGFDIYSVDAAQMKRINTFMTQNQLRNPDLSNLEKCLQ